MAILGKKASYAIASSSSRQPSSLWQSIIRVGAARLGWPYSIDPKDSRDIEKENEKQPMVGGDQLLVLNKTERKPTRPDPSEGAGGKIN